MTKPVEQNIDNKKLDKTLFQDALKDAFNIINAAHRISAQDIHSNNSIISPISNNQKNQKGSPSQAK